MAILYELLSGGGYDGAAGRRARLPRWSSRRERRRASRACGCAPAPAEPATLLIRGARLLDPRAGIDGAHDLLVRDGVVAELGAPGALDAPEGCEVVEGEGQIVLPGFVDPHVHLRTPGREDEEDLESGIARGGGGRLLPDPRDAQHRSGRRRGAGAALAAGARRAARRSCPSASSPRSRRARRGTELTEMVELAREGAAGFSDDGFPVVDARRLRQALQYQRLAGGVLALHEEDPALSGDGAMHEGAVSTVLGLDGIPSISESTMIERDAAIARYEGGAIHILHLSAAESVAAVERARAAGVRITAEVTPAPPGADRRGRHLARLALQDESAVAVARPTARH